MNRQNDIDYYKGLYGFKAEDLAKSFADNTKYDQVTALGGDLYTTDYQFMPVELGGVQLWNPIVRIVGRKTIIETPMVERRGSVKEIISTDDYIINIRGLIKGENGLWPDEELGRLIALYERNEAVSIESALTNRVLNGEEYVVITNLQIPDRAGWTDVIPYELECVVDIPFELELDEDGN